MVMSRFSPNTVGSLTMALGTLAYVVNDAFMVSITRGGPGPYQALCMRSVLLVVVFGVVGRVRGQQLRRHHLCGALWLRTATEVGGAACFYAALVRLEFANIQAIVQVLPLLVTLGAAIVLRERVSVARYAAILTGFVGVLILVRPTSDAFSFWSLLAVITAILLTVREFATRRIPDETPMLAISWLTAAGLATLTGLLSVPGGWHGLAPSAWWQLAGAAAALFCGYLLSIFTVRVGDLSVSAPFRYTNVVGAVVLGYLVFDQTPDLATWVGGVVIVAAGLWSVRLERRETAGVVTALPGGGDGG